MVKHTQTIARLLPTNCLSVFDHFVGLVLKGLKTDVLASTLNFKTHRCNFFKQLGNVSKALSKTS